MNAPPPPSPALGGEVTVGELGRWLNRVDKNLVALTEELQKQRAEYVHRTEWDLWRENANRELSEMRDAAKAALTAATAASKAAEGAAGVAGAAKASVEDLVSDVVDHEKRIRSLEHTIWRAAGAAAGVGALLGFGANQLLHIVP